MLQVTTSNLIKYNEDYIQIDLTEILLTTCTMEQIILKGKKSRVTIKILI